MSSAENATENTTSHNEEPVDYVELALDDVKVGRQFSSYEEALNSVLKWCKVVEVLWIQTLAMKTDLAKTRPQTFQCDTTFSTNREGKII